MKLDEPRSRSGAVLTTTMIALSGACDRFITDSVYARGDGVGIAFELGDDRQHPMPQRQAARRFGLVGHGGDQGLRANRGEHARGMALPRHRDERVGGWRVATGRRRLRTWP